MAILPGVLEKAPLDDWRGFFIVAAAFLVQLTVWGVRASIPAFTHAIDRDPQFCDCYSTLPYDINSANATQQLIDIHKCCDNADIVATAVGISAGTGPIFGMVAGYLSGRFGARPLILISAVCCAASTLLCTVATSSVTFLLAYGPLMGIASGFMVTPGAFAVGTRFDKLLSLAMGILYGGGGLGSALIPRLAGGMLTAMGSDSWRVVQQYLAIFTALTLVMGIFVRERRLSLQGPAPKPKQEKEHLNVPSPVGYSSLSDSTHNERVYVGVSINNAGDDRVNEESAERKKLLKSLVLSKKYFVSLLCTTLYGFSYYAGLFCLIPYARAHGDPTSEAYHQYTPIDLDEASNMMLFFGITQCVGSVVLGVISTKLNFYWTNMVCAIGSAAAIAALPSCHTFVSIGTVAALFGLFSAGCRMCFPSMMTNMFFGPCLGTLIGLTLMGYGIGALPGPTLVSKITHANAENYNISFYIVSAGFGLYGLFSFLLRRWAPAGAISENVMHASFLQDNDEAEAAALFQANTKNHKTNTDRLH